MEPDVGTVLSRGDWKTHGSVGRRNGSGNDRSVVPLRTGYLILCDKSETRKYIDAATFALSHGGTDVTSDEQRKTRGAVSCTGGASTWTRALEVVNGSVSLIGSLPNCPADMSGADGFPSVVSHDRDRIVFLESCHSSCSDGDASVDVTSSTWPCGSNGFLIRNTTSFDSVCKVFIWPEWGAPQRRHRGGLRLLLVDLG